MPHTLTGIPSIVEQLDLDDTATAALREMEHKRTHLENKSTRPFYQDTLNSLDLFLFGIQKRYTSSTTQMAGRSTGLYRFFIESQIN